MNKLLWVGKCRMYFNAYEEGPFFWSVDNGETVTEVKATKLIFKGANFKTVVNAGNKQQPKAWIEAKTAALWQAEDGSITIYDRVVRQLDEPVAAELTVAA